VLLLGERVTFMLPVSLAMVIGGSLLLLPRKGGRDSWRPLIPLTIIVSVLWGLDRLLRKYSTNVGMDVTTYIWISAVSAAIFMNILAGATRSWGRRPISRRGVALSVASAFSSHVVGTYLYMFALQMESVSLLEPFISVTIPFGFLLSVLVIHERPTRRALAGMAVIFLGVVLAAF